MKQIVELSMDGNFRLVFKLFDDNTTYSFEYEEQSGKDALGVPIWSPSNNQAMKINNLQKLAASSIKKLNRKNLSVLDKIDQNPDKTVPTTLVQISKVLTKEDPPLLYQLPENWDSIYFRFLVPDGIGKNYFYSSPKHPMCENNSEKIITSDPSEWFRIEFIDEYINKIKGVEYLKIDHTWFPDGNKAIDTGNFVLEVGYICY